MACRGTDRTTVAGTRFRGDAGLPCGPSGADHRNAGVRQGFSAGQVTDNAGLEAISIGTPSSRAGSRGSSGDAAKATLLRWFRRRRAFLPVVGPPRSKPSIRRGESVVHPGSLPEIEARERPRRITAAPPIGVICPVQGLASRCAPRAKSSPTSAPARSTDSPRSPLGDLRGPAFGDQAEALSPSHPRWPGSRGARGVTACILPPTQHGPSPTPEQRDRPGALEGPNSRAWTQLRGVDAAASRRTRTPRATARDTRPRRFL